jgi:hypothetical protein
MHRFVQDYTVWAEAQREGHGVSGSRTGVITGYHNPGNRHGLTNGA